MSLFGHSIRFTPYFWLIWVFFVASHINFRSTADWQTDLIMAAIAFPIVTLSLFWHELGHIICHRKFGAHNLETVFGAYGGRSSSDGQISAKRRIILAMAGPIFTLVLLLTAVVVKRVIPGLGEDVITSESLRLLVTFNFIWTAANVLPIFPMDCGWIIRAIYPHSHIILSIVGIILSALAMVLGYLTKRYGATFLFAVLLYVNVRRLFMKNPI